ncbi:MAG: tubulin-like doman-containing protein [Nitrospirota bacterium]
MFIPTVLVGVGGVGKNILLRTRRMIIENYGDFSKVPSIEFIHVDTDNNSMPDGGSKNINMQILGKRIDFTDTERCSLSNGINKELAYKSQIKERVKEWFPTDLTIDNNFSEGAGGIRPYGRLAFQYSVDIFRDKLGGAIQRVMNNENRQKTAETIGIISDSGVAIYILCSLLGGTGSGSFLEVCYNSRITARDKGFNAHLTGMFVVGGNVDDRKKANCYASLMELEYHSTEAIKQTPQHFITGYPIPNVTAICESDSPVDICYLVSNRGEGYLLERDEVEEAIALNVYMDFGSRISSEKRSRRVDLTAIDDFMNLDEEMKKSKQFMSFGITTIEFPAPRLHDMMSHRLASFILNGWLSMNHNVSTDIDKTLIEIQNKLNEKALLAGLQKIGNKSLYSSIKANISQMELDVLKIISGNRIDASQILSTVNNNKTAVIESITFSWDPKFCGRYADSITQQGYVMQKELYATITENVHSLIENEHKGPDVAKLFLNNISSLLNTMKGNFEKEYKQVTKSADYHSKEIDDAIRKLANNLSGDKFAIEHHNKNIHDKYLSNYVVIALKREAYRTALSIIADDRDNDGRKIFSLIKLVDSLLKDVDKYKDTLNRCSVKLNEHAEEIEDIIIHSDKSRELSLNSNRVKALYRTILPNPEHHVKRTMSYIIDKFSERDRDGQIYNISNIMEILINNTDAVIKEVILKCSEYCAEIKNISIAKDLVNKENLVAIISKNINLSRPMLELSGFSEGECVRLSWLASSQQEGELTTIINEINRIHNYSSGMNDKHFSNLNDKYRIIFASEIAIFPIRRINILREYSIKYRMVKPHHTDKRISYPDLLPKTKEDEIRVQAAYCTVIGMIFKFLSEKADPESGYMAIYLCYFDENSKTDIFEKICEKADEVENNLAQQQISKDIDKQYTGTTNLETLTKLIDDKGNGCSKKVDREKIWNDLQEHLFYLEKKYTGGSLNPEFGRQRNIIQQFRDKYNIKAPDNYEKAI